MEIRCAEQQTACSLPAGGIYKNWNKRKEYKKSIRIKKNNGEYLISTRIYFLHNKKVEKGYLTVRTKEWLNSSQSCRLQSKTKLFSHSHAEKRAFRAGMKKVRKSLNMFFDKAYIRFDIITKLSKSGRLWKLET